MSDIAEIIRKTAPPNQYVKILTSMPGLDYFDAMFLASEIGDISRPSSQKKLVSWECILAYRSSGIRHTVAVRKKQSNGKANWILFQAANTASQNDSKLSEYYDRIKARHARGHNVIITHLANKMIRIIWHMLICSELYRGDKAGTCERKPKSVSRRHSGIMPRGHGSWRYL